ncbi:MAG: hypothetical protein AAGG09_22355 [Pseudomonadota bacterium]
MLRFLTLTTALSLATPALAGEEMKYRLLVADAGEGALHAIDIEHESAVAPVTFELASAGRLYLGPDGRHVWVVQRDAGIVQLFDSGVVEEDHGDHAALVLEPAALLPATASGERPVHFNMGGDRVAVFWDGVGKATLHDASAAAAGDLTPLMTLDTGGAHHGVAVPVGETVISSIAPEGEGLPDALAVFGADGTELSRVDCLNMHGEGKAAGFIAFGCEDGVALFDTSATPPEGRFVAYPEDAPEGMLRTLLSPRDMAALVGNFGATGIAIFDPAAADGDFFFAALPAPRMAFALDDAGAEGYAILADGRLVQFSALTGKILGEVAGVTGAYAMERGVTRPMMDVAGDRIAVSDPAAGQVVLLDREALEITARIDAGAAPRAVLLMAVEADHAH